MATEQLASRICVPQYRATINESCERRAKMISEFERTYFEDRDGDFAARGMLPPKCCAAPAPRWQTPRSVGGTRTRRRNARNLTQAAVVASSTGTQVQYEAERTAGAEGIKGVKTVG